MKNTIILSIAALFFSSASFAANSIACVLPSDDEVVVILMHRLDGSNDKYRTTVVEGIAPNYLEDKILTLEKNNDGDVLSLKENKLQIRISLTKGFVKKSGEGEDNDSKAQVLITDNHVTKSNDLVCFIYE